MQNPNILRRACFGYLHLAGSGEQNQLILIPGPAPSLQRTAAVNTTTDCRRCRHTTTRLPPILLIHMITIAKENVVVQTSTENQSKIRREVNSPRLWGGMCFKGL